MLLLIAGCLLGWLGRYHVIEPEAIHRLCMAGDAPGWCAPRDGLIRVTFSGFFGWFAVAAASAGWLLRGRTAGVAVLLALLTGGLGLFLFDTAWAASAVLAALLRLARVDEDPPDPREFIP